MSQTILIEDYLEQFAARFMQDALNEATSRYWLRRAAQFDAVGTDHCSEIAEACRNRARLAWDGDLR